MVLFIAILSRWVKVLNDGNQENILIKLGSCPVLADFGVDALAGSRFCATHTYGQETVFYMAPEVSFLRHYTNKVDIYSLGIVLFEVLLTFSSVDTATIPWHSTEVFSSDF